MIVLKVHFLTIKFCSDEDFENVKTQIINFAGNTELSEYVNVLFSQQVLKYEVIKNIVVPENSGNVLYDKFLKALHFSQEYEKDIILKKTFDIISSSEHDI